LPHIRLGSLLSTEITQKTGIVYMATF